MRRKTFARLCEEERNGYERCLECGTEWSAKTVRRCPKCDDPEQVPTKTPTPSSPSFEERRVEAVADALYSPPICNPEGLARHGDRLEKRNRDSAHRQAMTVIDADPATARLAEQAAEIARLTTENADWQAKVQAGADALVQAAADTQKLVAGHVAERERLNGLLAEAISWLDRPMYTFDDDRELADGTRALLTRLKAERGAQ